MSFSVVISKDAISISGHTRFLYAKMVYKKLALDFIISYESSVLGF